MLVTPENASEVFLKLGYDEFIPNNNSDSQYRSLTVQEIADILGSVKESYAISHVRVEDNGITSKRYEDGIFVSETASSNLSATVINNVLPRYAYYYKTITTRFPKDASPSLKLDIRDCVYFSNDNASYWTEAGTPNLTADGQSSVGGLDFGTRCEPGTIRKLSATKQGSSPDSVIRLDYDFDIKTYITLGVGEVQFTNNTHSGSRTFNSSWI